MRDHLPPPQFDWIRFLWNKMNQETKSFEDLKSNDLSIITFNFDLCIEYKLLNAILGLYAVTKEEAWDYVTNLVSHVHGALTPPNDRTSVPDEWLKKALEEIAVVHQDIHRRLTFKDASSDYQCADRRV